MPNSLLTRLPRYGDGDGKAIGSVQFIVSFEFVEESLGSVGFLESIGSAQSVGSLGFIEFVTSLGFVKSFG